MNLRSAITEFMFAELFGGGQDPIKAHLFGCGCAFFFRRCFMDTQELNLFLQNRKILTRWEGWQDLASTFASLGLPFTLSGLATSEDLQFCEDLRRTTMLGARPLDKEWREVRFE